MKKCIIFLGFIALLLTAAGFLFQQYLITTPVYKVYKIYKTVDAIESSTDLGFTAKQKELIREIRKLLLKQGEALNDGGGDIISEFITEFKSDRFNQPRMNSMAGKMVRRVQGIMPQLFSRISALHRSLTPLQKEKIVALLGEMDNF